MREGLLVTLFAATACGADKPRVEAGPTCQETHEPATGASPDVLQLAAAAWAGLVDRLLALLR
jgi:hypothetical protein